MILKNYFYTRNSCFYSSFLFLINVFSGIYYQEIIYTNIFIYLFLTSIYYHGFYTRLGYILDQAGCLSSVLYTFYLLCNNINYTIVPYYLYLSLSYIFSLSYVLFSYFYGKKIKMFSHHPNRRLGNYYHSLLHLVASFGCYTILVLQAHVTDGYLLF